MSVVFSPWPMSFLSVQAVVLQACAKLSGNIKDAGHQPGLPSQADTWPRSRRSVVFSLYGSKQPTFLLFGRPGSRESHASLARSCTIYQSGVCPTPRVFPKQGMSSGFDWVFQTRASACSSSGVIHSGSEA